MQDQVLRTWDDGLDRPGTVGELIEFLQGIDPTLPVQFIHDGGWTGWNLEDSNIDVDTEKGVQRLTFSSPW